MKKYISSIISSIFIFIIFAQKLEYPRIETDLLGNKIVLLTIDQAHKIDNKLELLKLFEKQSIQFDSLNFAYIKVIDELNSQVTFLELNVKTLKEQINDNNKQIHNLKKQLDNEKSSNELCEYQKNTKDEEIKILKKELKKQKFQKVVGFVVGGVGVVGGIVLAILL
jgi:chromosome segregation ATPase